MLVYKLVTMIEEKDDQKICNITKFKRKIYFRK
jgi:hypothetical protein